ncbi:MAG: curved DNA-binding protein CbpA [Myxococcota bacterium]|jgi:curved DNA-binding protein CbpA
MADLDPYATLGLPTDADETAVKAAWRTMARRHHPDRGGNVAAFTEVRAAWELLSDPLRREFYDRFGKDATELGLSRAALRQALKQRLVGEERPKVVRPPRSECTTCLGTGIRPSGRVCTACDPNADTARPAGPDWDPTADSGRRVRVGRRTKPKPAPSIFTEAPKPEPPVEKPAPDPKTRAGRFRLRRDD